MPDAPSTLCGPRYPPHLSVTQRSLSYALLLVSVRTFTVHSLHRSFYFFINPPPPFSALYLTKIFPVCYYIFFSSFLPSVRLIRPLDVLLL